MNDHFKIKGTTCVNVSGGRTSAYLLKNVIDSNNGIPDDTHIIFCNTGKEEEATLKFVNDISLNWNVNIVWLEYRPNKNFEIVTYETASRNGEPFNAIVQEREILPNPRARYCSSELKTRTGHRYLRSIGLEEWDTFLGIRADEPTRVAKYRLNPHPETKDELIKMPLVDKNISAYDVGNFWKKNDFDLGLPNINGKTIHGNCDLCFLKNTHSIVSLISEKPSRANWWVEKEKQARQIATGNGAMFRIDRPTYTSIHDFVDKQTVMHSFDENEEMLSCFCGD